MSFSDQGTTEQLVIAGLDPAIHDELPNKRHLSSPKLSLIMDATELGPARVRQYWIAASRVNPTCRVKPGHDVSRVLATHGKWVLARDANSVS